MLLAIDVGNSNNVIGLFSGEKLLTHWRIRTEWNRTADEYWVLIKEFILLNNVETETIDDIIIACVVPPLVPILQGMAKKYFACEPLIVGPGVKTGISILYRNPSEVGADRIVNSVAAFEKYGGPLIIVDFGTATTFDVVSNSPTVEPVDIIPDWIKIHAEWWANGQIDDLTYLLGIEYLVKEGVIITEQTGDSDFTSPGSPKIPKWIKANAEWWANGQISDIAYVSGIQHLIKVGIIKVFD